jgi:hypothetical protein
LPERGARTLGIPDQLVVAIQRCSFICNRNDLGGVVNLLFRDAGLIAGDPEQGNVSLDAWGEVGVAGDLLVVHVLGLVEIVGHVAAERLVITVDMGLEEFGEEVGLRDRGWSGIHRLAILLLGLGGPRGDVVDGGAEGLLLFKDMWKRAVKTKKTTMRTSGPTVVATAKRPMRQISAR